MAASFLGSLRRAVFFASLQPRSTPRGAATFSALVVLGLVFCALTLVWLASHAVLVALGLRIVAEHR